MKDTVQLITRFQPRLSLGGLTRFVMQIRRWTELAKQRHQLAQLDARALRDIGVMQPEAIDESKRPFWDDPLKHGPPR